MSFFTTTTVRGGRWVKTLGRIVYIEYIEDIRLSGQGMI